MAPKLRVPDPSPAAQLIGRKVTRINPRTGDVWLQFRSQPSFLNRHGFVQGGLVAAMLDSTVGCTALVSLSQDESIVTLEMKVTYVRPAPSGILRGVGRILQRGRSILFVEGDLRDASGDTLARASATLRIVPSERRRTTPQTG